MPHLDPGVPSLDLRDPSVTALHLFQHFLFNQSPPLGYEFFQQELQDSSVASSIHPGCVWDKVCTKGGGVCTKFSSGLQLSSSCSLGGHTVPGS